MWNPNPEAEQPIEAIVTQIMSDGNRGQVLGRRQAHEDELSRC
jgi:hypothetical protein